MAKKHRHKWRRDVADCPFCGGGEYEICEDCGAERDIKTKKIIAE